MDRQARVESSRGGGGHDLAQPLPLQLSFILGVAGGVGAVASRGGRQGRQCLRAPESKGPPSGTIFFNNAFLGLIL